MSYSTIHLATSSTSWRVLSLLRLGERRIYALKRALGMTESAFSHALRKLEELSLVETQREGREKITKLTQRGRIVFSSLQALCIMLSGADGTSVEDDSALVSALRDEQLSRPKRGNSQSLADA